MEQKTEFPFLLASSEMTGTRRLAMDSWPDLQIQ